MSRRCHSVRRGRWRPSSCRPLALPLIAATLVLLSSSGCWSRPKWRRTGEFLGELRCGMARAEVETLGRRYPRLKLYQPEYASDGCPLAAQKGNTTICMDFNGGGLRSAHVTWIDTIMHVQELPEIDLCESSEVPREPHPP